MQLNRFFLSRLHVKAFDTTYSHQRDRDTAVYDTCSWRIAAAGNNGECTLCLDTLRQIPPHEPQEGHIVFVAEGEVAAT